MAFIKNNRQNQAFLLLGLVMMFWAGNSIIGRAVRFDVPPFTLALVRWMGASLVLLPFAIRPVMRDLAALRAGWRPVLILGLLGVAAFNALLYTGLRHTPATNALLLQAATPALVVLLDRIIFKTRTPFLQRFGVAASILGVAVIVFKGDLAAALRVDLGGGDLIVLAAVLAWSLYTVLLRLRPNISAVSFIAVTFAIGAVAMMPLAMWEAYSGQTIRWSWGVAGAFAYVAVLPSLVSYFIYNWAAQTVGPARAGQAITLMPLFGAFMSAALLGETLHLYHFAGMALIVAGIGFAIITLRQQQAASAGAGAALEDKA